MNTYHKIILEVLTILNEDYKSKGIEFVFNISGPAITDRLLMFEACVYARKWGSPKLNIFVQRRYFNMEDERDLIEHTLCMNILQDVMRFGIHGAMKSLKKPLKRQKSVSGLDYSSYYD